MSPEDIAAIEQATLAAVSPEAVEAWPGWLLPFDSGPIGRAKSAAPLSHEAPAEDISSRIAAAYRARGLAPAFRLPALPAFDPLRADLAARGYRPSQPTCLQCAPAADVAARAPAPPDAPARIEVARDAGEDWASLFLGEGFDPVEGAGRVASLRRGQASLFATLYDHEGRPAAAGALACHAGWGGIHGMRTARAQRGQGHAARVVGALAREAMARGVTRLFLQVEVDNAPALALYGRLGFETQWVYAYWRPGD
ncbi:MULTISPECIES: GNAT family N-acetyltransferase [Ramlibacter]|uniref:GNAT family N-acetyltransferase n=1 Tax=Ramlibacter aquaticus TaxID=2780094 RepID=A0ABR9S9L2_9BURK|nr:MULTISPECIES: GNAT family N-acetyltransferase [Ramlibacter]MBE7939030.1 GNAT family N-acetyltransferase [Ramlibacter aquaticus]